MNKLQMYGRMGYQELRGIYDDMLVRVFGGRSEEHRLPQDIDQDTLAFHTVGLDLKLDGLCSVRALRKDLGVVD